MLPSRVLPAGLVPARLFVGLLCLHAVMLAYGGWVHGPGWDEGGHLPAGISHWQTGSLDAYRVNPPLVRLIATAPIAWRDFGLQYRWSPDPTYRPEWDLGNQFWKTQGRDAYRYLTIARWFCIPWSVLAAVVIYRWGGRLYGAWAGLFSAGLWCFSPLVLTNAQMITPDTAASMLGAAASLSFWKWLRGDSAGRWGVALDTGLLLGLAELSKFTWVILYGIWPAVWMVEIAARWIRDRRNQTLQSIGESGLQLLAILAISVAVINLGYALEGTGEPLGEYRFVSKAFQPPPQSSVADTEVRNRFSGTWLESIPVPVPRNYVLGIDRQKLDFESDFKSYLGGQWRDQGWWYYYGYGLIVKEPVGYLLLFGWCVVMSVARRWRAEEVFLCLPAIVLFSLVSSQTGFNHHLRYVLPALPFVFIWMGQWVAPESVSRWPVAARWRVAVGVFLFGTSVLASVWVFPHSHAYFNRFAGGPMRGHDHLLDSNIDWGQDILLLSRWVEANPDRPIDGVAYSLDWLIDRGAIHLPLNEPPVGFRGDLDDSIDRAGFGPRAGRYAVFVRPLREWDRRFAYFRFFQPVEVLGYTVYLYELTEDDVRRYWESNRQVLKR